MQSDIVIQYCGPFGGLGLLEKPVEFVTGDARHMRIFLRTYSSEGDGQPEDTQLFCGEEFSEEKLQALLAEAAAQGKALCKEGEDDGKDN